MNIERSQMQAILYLEGTLSEAEQLDFERQQSESAELRELVQTYRQMRLMQQHQPLMEALGSLRQVMETTPVIPKYGAYQRYFETSWWMRFKSVWIVLAIGLTCWLGWGIIQQQSSNTKFGQLSNSVLEPLENFINFTPGDSSAAAAGMRAYDAKNYPQAIALIESALQEQSDDNSLALYLAVSYQFNQQPELALPLLRRIAKGSDVSAVPAQWYLALNYLTLNEVEDARATLRLLLDDPVYGTRARNVLAQL